MSRPVGDDAPEAPTATTQPEVIDPRVEQSMRLWLCMQWCRGVRRQIQRVRDAVAAFHTAERLLAPKSGPNGETVVEHGRLTPETEQRRWDLTNDSHLLFVASYQLIKALEGVDELPKDTEEALRLLRHCLEHVEKARTNQGAWKGLRERFGHFAPPGFVRWDGSGGVVLSPFDIDLSELDAAVSALHERLAVEALGG
jgi:hypothetical protein